ncbi:MAG TPA: hypothetical protein VMV72_16530 [Verrucomicrobiae bacterium]|nr:hypothetical protein [Verrucomicrobiae bacterium]
MKTLKMIPSCLAAVAAVAFIALPIMGGPTNWRDRLYDPAIFLTALAFAGAAIVLWPLGSFNTRRD